MTRVADKLWTHLWTDNKAVSVGVPCADSDHRVRSTAGKPALGASTVSAVKDLDS